MREMKGSGYAWLGDIPCDWEIERFQSYLDEVKESNNPIKTQQILSLTNKRGVIPYEEKGAQGNVAKENYSDYKLAYPGTIVANSMNILIGSVGICNYYGCVSPVYYVFKPNKRANIEFINYIFQTEQFQKELRRYANGILEIRLRLSAGNILKRKAAFPSLKEQEVIVNILNQKCSEVDALIANEEKQIEKLKEYKQSVITEAVTKGLDPDTPMKDSGVEWIGLIPQNWDIYRIASLYSERNERGSEDLPILTVSINTGITDYEVSDEERTRIVNRSEDRTKYKRVYVGDLAYNMMRAWQGAFGAVRVNGMVSPAYTVAKPNGIIEIDSRYLEALLRTPSAIEEMHRYSRGIMDFRLRLYWPEFRAIKVCVPSLEEQIKIADQIDLFNKQVDILIKIKQKKIDKLSQYKKSLIFEYITGKKEADI